MKFDSYVVSVDESIRKALEVINANKQGFAVVQGHDGKVQGVLTDGDVRRGIINGYTAEDSVDRIFTRGATLAYVNDSFEKIYQLYVKQPKHYNMYTIVLTLSRIIRTHFNDNIFSKEVDNIFDSFSSIFIIYLVLSVLIEIVIFFILNFGIISDVRKTNKLLLDFMSSLKF